MRFGEKLRKLRIEKRLQRFELARKLGVSNDHIFGWEFGYRRPTDDDFEAISSFFEISVEELKDGTEFEL